MRFLAGESGGKFARRKDGRGEMEEADVIGAIGEPVGAGAEVDGGGHDQLFADGIDGGIGDLGKELTEVVIEEARAAGENGEGGIVAHGTGGFLGIFKHGQKDDFKFFVRVTEGEEGGLEIGRNGGEGGG